MNKLYVIGIGYKPLDEKAREVVLNSEIVLASNRILEVFKGYEEFERVKNKVKTINNVDETINFIHSELSTQNSKLKTIVLLASGDPMFFGIGRRAIREFGEDMVEILPDLSSIQIAFSRIKEPWDDAFLMSLHGGPDPEKRRRLEYKMEDIPLVLIRYNKIAILTDKENNSAKIAKVINSELRTQNSKLIMYVCERLGYPDEKITEGTPKEIAGMSFSEPNVVIIQNKIPPPSPSMGSESLALEVRFGLTENEILQSRGLITKDEVRAVTIHKLRLPRRGVFWDIGAGSGSVSIEIARLYPELKVFAIEKDEEQIKNIKENKIRFNTSNIEIIKGEAPDALVNLPSPDRVFIGGSGGKLAGIMDFIAKMPATIVVINATTIETLNEAIKHLENNGFNIKICEISVSRSKIIANRRHMQALNPVFIITGEKQE
ncbi:MAG: precorrin-6y C5,15-methyltransferase (decarboxylating) subunit CbiE [Nitrospirota bacterium]|nr:precorrin-6y C5,15-methyltransferase (decarboxylating) subunit CbiE [Nitrospirota bacterium]